MDELFAIFLEESSELVEALETGLVSLEREPGDPETLHRVFRAAHTLKSSAAMVGLDPLVELNHALESVLDRLRSGQLRPSRALISLLLESVDVGKALLQQAAEGRTPSHPGLEAQLARLRRFSGELAPGEALPEPEPAPSPRRSTYRIRLAFKPDFFQTGVDPVQLVEDLAGLGELEVTLRDAELPPLEQLDPYRLYLSWDLLLRTDAPREAIDELLLFYLDDNPIRVEPVPEEKQGELATADRRIGELLVEEGKVRPEDVARVLEKQRPTGELLVEEGKVRPEDVARALERQARAREARQASTLRVDVSRVDELVNLVGEMVIGISQLQVALQDRLPVGSEAASLLNTLSQQGRALRDAALGLRMVPLGGAFARFQRLVRDLSAELGRPLILLTQGTETELDKNVVDRLLDPLKHLVRNAAYHGIEPPEERRAAGKPEQGTIALRAYQQEGLVVIEVADDGRGLDTDRILERARELGLWESEERPPDERIHAFIFEPGLSTSRRVDEVAGRGVGMDVVKTEVEKLRGRVEVVSHRGEGTTFRLKLPLTLAIIDAMQVEVGGQVYTVPIHAIEHLLRPAPGEVVAVEARGELLRYRGEVLPLVRLDRLFDFPESSLPPERRYALLLRGEGRRFALLVDGVLGECQAVLKSLDETWRREGISGATILGDGRVSLILDIPSLARLAFGRREGGLS